VFRTVASERGTLLGALLFAAHPLHAEAVAGVVGRAEVFALAFALASLLAHVHGRGVRGGVLEGVALFSALGSKESAIATIPIAVALDLVRAGKLEPRKFAAPLLSLGVYVAARAVAIGELVATPTAHTLGDKSLRERLPFALGVLRDAWRDVL